MRLSSIVAISLLVCGGAQFTGCQQPQKPLLQINDNARIALVGNNLCARMIHFGELETALHLRFPHSSLTIRNLCDGGDTPGFRPHAARDTPWAFPGAAAFQGELANPSGSEGHFPGPDEWLDTLDTDIILAFWGFNAAQRGGAYLPVFKEELRAFIHHTRSQQYNEAAPPQLVLISPPALQDLSGQQPSLPPVAPLNARLRIFSQAILEVAEEEGVPAVDLFGPSQEWYKAGTPLTIDGLQFNQAGYERLSAHLMQALTGRGKGGTEVAEDQLNAAVLDKNWYWLNDYKIPNGVHVYGRRYQPFGPDNYPAEIEKVRQLTMIRDTAIWKMLRAEPYDIARAELRTKSLPAVETNFHPEQGVQPYLYGEDAEAALAAAPGYEVNLFASEEDFPDLANPVQLSFDNKGRLWVAAMPSYPHYRPGDSRPDDKLLILEDTDGDGKADKQKVFASGLHLPIGFEIAPEGVYVSQGSNLVLLKDHNGDDRADEEVVLLSGFDDHDTHHAISAFCAGPSGAIFMAEGVFLHTNVETPHGTVRGTNGGFYRYNPARQHLERTAQLDIPNPWGIAFDDWGQPFFAETSGPDVRWLSPGTIAPVYGTASPKGPNIIESAHRVRPTSGLEFVSSRHFPPEVQGDLLINNTIGFLGTKQHRMVDTASGYMSRHRQDLLWGSDPHFRPVDMEFAPDGSLYVIDWHNRLIGHMQHNARDPLRDHAHGRVYRVTYPSRPLLEPAVIAGAPIPDLLENLKLPEYRTRYRTRRELRGRDAVEVLPALRKWAAGLDPSAEGYEHHLLEALWVSWGLDAIEVPLLRQLLSAQNYRARAAAVRALRYNGHKVPQQEEWLLAMAEDPHGRVRLEAVVAASWLSPDLSKAAIARARQLPVDGWAAPVLSVLEERYVPAKAPAAAVQPEASLGQSIYHKDGYCATCHQADGKGLSASGFPPLSGSEWVIGDKERLIKLTLKGLYGPIEVNGKKYPGQVPMTAFEGLLSDEEMAAVLTYVRSSFGNDASRVTADEIAAVRKNIVGKKGFYTPEELYSPRAQK